MHTLTEFEILNIGSNIQQFYSQIANQDFLFTQKSNPNHRVYRLQLILMQFTNLHIILTAGKNLALPDTRSQNTPLDLLRLKTMVELPQNKIFFLAKDETSPQLECKYAVETDSDTTQKIISDHFHSYLDCQNNQ